MWSALKEAITNACWGSSLILGLYVLASSPYWIGFLLVYLVELIIQAFSQ